MMKFLTFYKQFLTENQHSDADEIKNQALELSIPALEDLLRGAEDSYGDKIRTEPTELEWA